MGIADDAVEIRSQGWRTLAALHGALDTELERALQREHKLSVVEYTVLDALSRQDGWHMRMAQLARAAALSSSATTRLVNRLEDRGLLTRIL
ncbi:MarR family transcriptional regulator, partial [Rhodococcus erythropolis]|nr:MarR family transcriptional regulator [Rhodococcus erythropolis]